MARIETNVAGTTHQSVDFAKISSKSAVSLKHEPTNPFDASAIKVIIDGNHGGYIKRTENSAILEQLRSGNISRVSVKAVVGGGPGKNHGIVLSIVFASRPQPANNVSGGAVSDYESFSVHKAPIELRPHFDMRDAFARYLEATGRIEALKPVLLEPNYSKLYDAQNSVFKRLIFGVPDDFIKKHRAAWTESVALANVHNEKRESSIASFLALQGSAEFREHLKEWLKSRIRSEFRASFLSESEVVELKSQGYVSDYEDLVYSSIRSVFPSFRQVDILGHKIDVLAFNAETRMLWAIEIDGGIHRRSAVAWRDRSVNATLTGRGVSVIRVANSQVRRGLAHSVERIRNAILTET